MGAYGVVQGISHPLQRLIIEVLFNTRRWRLISDYLYGWMGPVRMREGRWLTVDG